MPVAVTVYIPVVAEFKVQDALAVPLGERLVAVVGQLTVRPVIGITNEDNETVPAKLFWLVSEMDMDAPEAPLLKFTGVPAEMVKSPTCTTDFAE